MYNKNFISCKFNVDTRFIFQFEKDPGAGGSSARWGDNEAQKGFMDDFRRGRTDVTRPPEIEPTKEGPINPGRPQLDGHGDLKADLKERFPTMADVITEMERIENSIWNQNIRSLALNPDIKRILPNLLVMKEAALYKGIVDQIDKKTLVKKFEASMQSTYDIGVVQDWKPEVWDKVVRTWDWVLTNDATRNLQESPHLADRQIKPEHRWKYALELLKVQTEKRKQIIDPQLARDKLVENPRYHIVDNDKLEYVEKSIIPMYLDFTINAAIVNDLSPADTDKDGVPDVIEHQFAYYADKIYRSCLLKTATPP